MLSTKSIAVSATTYSVTALVLGGVDVCPAVGSSEVNGADSHGGACTSPGSGGAHGGVCVSPAKADAARTRVRPMIKHSRFKLFISVSSGWYLMLRVSLNEQDEARFGTFGRACRTLRSARSLSFS